MSYFAPSDIYFNKENERCRKILRKAKLFIINASILAGTTFLINSITMTFNVYVSSKIGSEGIGLFQLIMSVYLFAVTVANSGINLAATRIVSEEMALDKQGGAKKAARKCICYSLILGITAGVLLSLNAGTIVHLCLHDKISNTPLYVISMGLPFIAMSAAINGYFSAVRKVSKTASSQLLEQAIRIGITIYLLTILLPKGLEYACLALILGDCISEVCSFLYIFMLYQIDKRKLKGNKGAQESYTKRILGISVPIALTSYIRSGLSTVKQLIIPSRLEKSGMSCDYALSRYGLIGGMVMPLLMFPCIIISALSNLLIPEFSAFYAKHNEKRINDIGNKILKMTLIFSVAVFGIFFTFHESLGIVIYNNLEVSKMLRLLCPLVLLMYIDNVVDGMLKGLNEQVSVMKCNILDLFVSISFIYFLLPIYGITGYMIVLYISEILNATISIRKLLKITHIKIDLIHALIIPLLGFLFARYFVMFCHVQISQEVVALILKVAIFLISYLMFVVLTSCITRKDIKL